MTKPARTQIHILPSVRALALLGSGCPKAAVRPRPLTVLAAGGSNEEAS